MGDKKPFIDKKTMALIEQYFLFYEGELFTMKLIDNELSITIEGENRTVNIVEHLYDSNELANIDAEEYSLDKYVIASTRHLDGDIGIICELIFPDLTLGYKVNRGGYAVLIPKN